MYDCRIVCDSLAPSGKRLTTMVITYPRFVHSEMLTHRDRARNSSSSRAIPWPKMMHNIVSNPVIPIRWGAEQKGMQTGGEVENPDAATQVWLEARDSAVKYAERLAALGVHKSLCNRLTEPFMWITVVMTATEWANLFRLRCHDDAEIHIQKIAYMMRDAMNAADPTPVSAGDWHLPFIQPDERKLEMSVLCRASVARCARVSYLTHEGERSIGKDLELFERLVRGSGFGHWSPHEHVAMAETLQVRSGPFIGWTQYRKTFPNENAIDQ